MGDPNAVDRCCQWLSGVRLYGQVLSLSPSKQLHLIDSSSSTYHLADGSNSFVDYSNSRNHRFTSHKMAAMNRLQKPNKVLHYYNAPVHFTEDAVKNTCERQNLLPSSIKVKHKHLIQYYKNTSYCMTHTVWLLIQGTVIWYRECSENEKNNNRPRPMSGTHALHPRYFTLTNHKSGRINLVNKGFLYKKGKKRLLI